MRGNLLAQLTYLRIICECHCAETLGLCIRVLKKPPGRSEPGEGLSHRRIAAFLQLTLSPRATFRRKSCPLVSRLIGAAQSVANGDVQQMRLTRDPTRGHLDNGLADACSRIHRGTRNVAGSYAEVSKPVLQPVQDAQMVVPSRAPPGSQLPLHSFECVRVDVPCKNGAVADMGMTRSPHFR